MEEDDVVSETSAVSPNTNTEDIDNCSGPPSSPTSDLYRLKYARLKEKFDYIRLSNNRLRNRLYHVKKEINRLKRMKHLLCQRLMLCADKYMEAHLEIPDIVMTSTNVEKSTVDPALRVTPVKRRRPLEVKRSESVSGQVDEMVSMEQKAKSSVISIIDSVITESHEERMRASTSTVSEEVPPLNLNENRSDIVLQSPSVECLPHQDPDSDPGDVLNEFGETLDKNFMAED
uniref:SERTA domain-containing protein n=1 Tax=Syphacia muris TaxID=451379 RepID=A0A0N5AIE9_9BILA